MKRDFTNRTKENLINTVEKMEAKSFWEKVWDAISDFGLIIEWFVRGRPGNAAGENEIRDYYEAIVDIKDYTKREIRYIFKYANQQDRVVAEKLREKNEVAKQILKELKELTEIITPNNIKNPTALGTKISEHINKGNVSIENGFVVSSPAAISNEQIINYCNRIEDSNENYRNLYRNVNDVLADMGLGTILLIAVLGHSDINKANIFSSKDGKELFRYVERQIINGCEGYDSIKSIAKRLGVSEEYVKHLMIKGRNQPPKPHDAFRLDDSIYKEKINAIIKENAVKALENKVLLEDICNHFDLDEDLVRFFVEGGSIDGYELEQYKKYVAEAVAETCERTEKTLYPKEYMSVVKDFMELHESVNGEEANKIIESWAKGALTDKEAKKLLAKYCGRTNIDTSYLTRLNEVSKAFDKIGDINKIWKAGDEFIQFLSFQLADHEAEINLLDNMMDSANDNPHYQLALKDLKDEYERSWYGALAKGTAEWAFDEGAGLLKGQVPLLSAAEVAIDLAGKLTGAEGYADAAQEIMGLSTIVPEAVDNYYDAVERVRNGDQSEDAVMDVRMSFEMMKATTIDYYEAQIRYAEGVCPGTSKYDPHIAYLEDELERIKRMELGRDFIPRSYEQYLAV